MFEVTRSCYYVQRLKRRRPDVERLRLRSRVSELFSQSRSAAGNRSILSLMRDDSEQLGRFKVRSLMRELDLVSKQPGSHAYKIGYQGTGYGLRATRKTSGLAVSLGSRGAVCESFISPAAVALPHAPEHESSEKLLGQCANGARVSQLENGVDTVHGLPNGSRSPARYQPLLDASVQLGSTPSIQRWVGASSGRRKT